jgi:hypothetical protein
MITYRAPQLFEECCVNMCVPEMFAFNCSHRLHHSIKTAARVSLYLNRDLKAQNLQ